jgi:hypothetical protein
MPQVDMCVVSWCPVQEARDRAIPPPPQVCKMPLQIYIFRIDSEYDRAEDIIHLSVCAIAILIVDAILCLPIWEMETKCSFTSFISSLT